MPFILILVCGIMLLLFFILTLAYQPLFISDPDMFDVDINETIRRTYFFSLFLFLLHCVYLFLGAPKLSYKIVPNSHIEISISRYLRRVIRIDKSSIRNIEIMCRTPRSSNGFNTLQILMNWYFLQIFGHIINSLMGKTLMFYGVSDYAIVINTTRRSYILDCENPQEVKRILDVFYKST